MATVKIKFRPSTVDGGQGTIFYQVIHNRVARQQKTGYRLYGYEWNSRLSDYPLAYSVGQLFDMVKAARRFCQTGYTTSLMHLYRSTFFQQKQRGIVLSALESWRNCQ